MIPLESYVGINCTKCLNILLSKVTMRYPYAKFDVSKVHLTQSILDEINVHQLMI
jgi:hypothetical protein